MSAEARLVTVYTWRCEYLSFQGDLRRDATMAVLTETDETLNNSVEPGVSQVEDIHHFRELQVERVYWRNSFGVKENLIPFLKDFSRELIPTV